MTVAQDSQASRASEREEFVQEAAADRTGLAAEFWDFLKHNKKWWLLPILVVMLLIGLLVVLGSTGAAPFIYPMF
jgi:hypothetical protein